MYNEQKNGNHSIEIDMKEQKSTNPLVLSKLKPQEIIRAYGSKLTNQSFALETIRNLVERNAVDIAVINAVIIAALRSKNDLPSLNYLEKVLNDWIKRGIDNEEAAYHYIMGDSSGTKPKTNKTNYRSNRVVKHVPDWVNDFIDSMETGETKHD
jgi:DNA replication protein DnaD